MRTEHRPFTARTIRRLSVLIILLWGRIYPRRFFRSSLAGNGRSAAFSTDESQGRAAVEAMTRMGQDFKESDSDSFAMIVLEGSQPLGDDAHAYYDQLVRELRNDSKHVEHVQDLWGDRLTASGAQSPDGNAVYTQVNLAGNQGTTLSQDSIAAVRNIVDGIPPPPHVDVYVTGPAALAADMQHAGDHSILKMTIIGAVIIFTVLIFVYRSIITVVALLVTVGVELFAARGVVAFLGEHEFVASPRSP